ncbi:uncharacterized protein LOC114247318 [Bombyx mandarina]|uniref:Uncharacterized protein LOC114247318 n=1 Tax=Bombyx mandarina TaxID=7092 RepID=A0A6J2K4Z6_BOMMA|nr:uncharacterized protein LOC114247318 [Bombyx mandarina]
MKCHFDVIFGNISKFDSEASYIKIYNFKLMDGYAYPYPGSFSPMPPMEGNYPDHGDGMGVYYDNMNDGAERRRSRSKHRSRKRQTDRSRSSQRSKCRSKSRSQSNSRSRSLSRTRTVSRSASGSKKDLKLNQPGFWDAFKVLYLTPSKHKNNTPKYLATKKRQDRIKELMKKDGLGSKRWLLYPRNAIRSEQDVVCRENCDQRIKVDGDYLRKCKKKKKIDRDAPIAKLKRWELLFYEKLGFIQAV